MDKLEAQNFALFLGQHADKVLELMKVGFFDMEGGSVTVHFKPDGKIGRIERNHVFIYS